jgi:tetratricopeptide (TPR) repeat protein
VCSSDLAKAEARFPLDRTIHQTKGQILYRLGRLDESLKSFLRVLAIDPEDRTAHYHRMLVYRAMAGDAPDESRRADLEKAAAEAEKAFTKFSIDESAQKWTNDFRRSRPDVHDESLPVHVHRLEIRR